ncbi:hypothetical protein PF008_g15670 [Phytophthora fragariae]|uniref:Uncharacterized protein n=1 Tax=Phytophthora fragariae TaxID=53985 RepID=A0A6G0RES1_9STRA|nr:hypothetical protein PF008_g15670 [Phytophthora fragariae]
MPGFMIWEYTAKATARSRTFNSGRRGGGRTNVTKSVVKQVVKPITGPVNATTADVGVVGVDMEAQVDIVAELEVMSLEFTYGWRIITVLGNSADELLVRARDTKSEWDLGDTGEPGQMSRLRRSSVSAECRHAWETSRCI